MPCTARGAPPGAIRTARGFRAATRSRYASAVDPRQRLETWRAGYWLTFWQCEHVFIWTGTILALIAATLAGWRSPDWWYWAVPAGATFASWLGARRFFRPKPRRLP